MSENVYQTCDVNRIVSVYCREQTRACLPNYSIQACQCPQVLASIWRFCPHDLGAMGGCVPTRCHGSLCFTDYSTAALLLPTTHGHQPKQSRHSWVYCMQWSCDQPCHNVYASILLEPFKWVIAWRDMISPAQFASMLDKAFFPKWLQVSSQDVCKHGLKLVMSICLLSPKAMHVPKYLRGVKCFFTKTSRCTDGALYVFLKPRVTAWKPNWWKRSQNKDRYSMIL